MCEKRWLKIRARLNTVSKNNRRATEARLMENGKISYLLLMLIVLGRTASALGNVTVRIPSWNSAFA